MNRVETLKKEFKRIFKAENTDLFSSPGRIELLGNHTDHNLGKVLVSSIDLDILVATSKRTDNHVCFYSHGYRTIDIDLHDLYKKDLEIGISTSMIRGVLYKLKALKYHIGGFNAVSDSIVPGGAGVSSSAAFEVLIGVIESYYYNDNKIPPFEIAKIAQYAECNFFGKPCGLLDQSGIALGGINYIDFANPDEPIINNIQIELPGYQFILVKTGGTHENLTSYYASIKDEMHQVSQFFHKDVLREVSKDEFDKHADDIKKQLGERPYLRAKHFYEENERVEVAYQSLLNHDYKSFLNMITSSGLSSYYQLQNCYCESEDELLATSLRFVRTIDDESYSRVHGGGFAGTLLYISPIEHLDENINKLNEYFGPENVLKVSLNKYGTRHID